MKPTQWLAAWGAILKGHAPMLSIEITRECPLSCPGCYAYGDGHLGGVTKLSELKDFRGDELVGGVIGLVQKHSRCTFRWWAVSRWSGTKNFRGFCRC